MRLTSLTLLILTLILSLVFYMWHSRVMFQSGERQNVVSPDHQAQRLLGHRNQHTDTFTSSSDIIIIHELDINNHSDSHLEAEHPLRPLWGVFLGLPDTRMIFLPLKKPCA